MIAADIQNAYLQDPSSQKHYVICGAEFGLENVGKVALIILALYGGKYPGHDFRNHLRECISHIGFVPCLDDPDICMREVQKADETAYWEYVMLHVDDDLVISNNSRHILDNEIGKYFIMRPGYVGTPDIYIGGHMRNISFENGAKSWGFRSSQYVQAAVKNVEEYLAINERKLPSKSLTPLQTSYQQEIDTTSDLNAVDSAYYQLLIGVLRLMVELGSIDIWLEVLMLSSHLALPIKVHLK